MKTSRTSLVLVNGTVILLAAIWTIPTLGLFITSFRTKAAIKIGMTTAGMVTARVLRKAVPRPSPPKITFW